MNNRVTSKRVLDILQTRHGTSSPTQVADALGIARQDSNGQAAVRKTLRRLQARGRTVQPQPGSYTVRPEGIRIPLTAFESMEKALADFLAKNGGVARTGEIHLGIWGKRNHGESLPYEGVLLKHVLNESPRFEQRFGHGHWNLASEEMAKVPLPGKWALKQIDLSYAPGLYSEAQHEARQEYCDIVGFAFMEARGEREIADVVADPTIATSLTEMLMKCAQGTRDAVEMAAGVSVMTADDTQMRALHTVAYTQFEGGNIGMHWAAQVAFYTACADLFGVCPIALSRGELPD